MKTRLPLLKTFIAFIYLAGLLFSTRPALAVPPCAIRVDGGAAAGGDGSTWPLAYNNLQDGIDAAYTVQPCQVWVKQGIYKPGGLRLSTFTMRNGVSVYGGFAGTESSLADRTNWKTHPTILSGDIGTIGDNSDNSYNVVDIEYLSPAITLDGFTITGGNANKTDTGPYYGGGIYIAYTSPILTNLIIDGNNSAFGGSGIYMVQSNALVSNTVFQNNTGLNIASIDASGAGVFIDNNSSPTFTNVTFTNNSASKGGGIYIFGAANVTISGATFSDNSATYAGGGLYKENSPSNTLSITNTTFTLNQAPSGAGAYTHGATTMNNVNFNNNTAGIEGGGLYVDINTYGELALSNAIFQSNTSSGEGGALYIYKSAPSITNSYFSQNIAATFGGAISAYQGTPTLTDVTLSNNSAAIGEGAGIFNTQGGHPIIHNSILWGDSHEEIYNYTSGVSSTITIAYSLVQGCNPSGVWNTTMCGPDGGNNLVDGDPLFNDPVQNDFKLQNASPAIDHGSNAFVSGVLLDLVGDLRIVNGTVDLGPYEHYPYQLYLPINIH